MKESKVENLYWTNSWLFLVAVMLLSGQLYVTGAIDRNTEAILAEKIEKIIRVPINKSYWPYEYLLCAETFYVGAPNTTIESTLIKCINKELSL